MRDNREDLTLPPAFMGSVYLAAKGRVTAPRRLWPPEELTALSEVVRHRLLLG